MDDSSLLYRYNGNNSVPVYLFYFRCLTQPEVDYGQRIYDQNPKPGAIPPPNLDMRDLNFKNHNFNFKNHNFNFRNSGTEQGSSSKNK